jgi:hypothetical protein
VAATLTVQPGQSFWSIAQQTVTSRLGAVPTTAQVAHYWSELVTANAGRLPYPRDPDILFVGTVLTLPPGT